MFMNYLKKENNIKSNFKNKNTFEIRCAESNKVLTKYPDRCPIICDKLDNINTPTIDKHKFLVPNDLTLGQFIYIIRKRLKINFSQALFIFINGQIFSPSIMISHLYHYEKDTDGFLYVFYSFENTFG